MFSSLASAWARRTLRRPARLRKLCDVVLDAGSAVFVVGDVAFMKPCLRPTCLNLSLACSVRLSGGFVGVNLEVRSGPSRHEFSTSLKCADRGAPAFCSSTGAQHHEPAT